MQHQGHRLGRRYQPRYHSRRRHLARLTPGPGARQAIAEGRRCSRVARWPGSAMASAIRSATMLTTVLTMETAPHRCFRVSHFNTGTQISSGCITKQASAPKVTLFGQTVTICPPDWVGDGECDAVCNQASPRPAPHSLTLERGQRAKSTRGLRCGRVRWRQNENCTGLAQIVGQLQGSNRDFQSNFWAKSSNLGQPCTIFVQVLGVPARGSEVQPRRMIRPTS
jgi:hypothetical protein